MITGFNIFQSEDSILLTCTTNNNVFLEAVSININDPKLNDVEYNHRHIAREALAKVIAVSHFLDRKVENIEKFDLKSVNGKVSPLVLTDLCLSNQLIEHYKISITSISNNICTAEQTRKALQAVYDKIRFS